MDYDKLIEQLNAWNEQHLSVVCGSKHFACDYLCENEDCIVVRAATALSTLQAENAQLRESRDHWKRLAHELSEGVNGKDAEHERLQAENEKLRVEAEGMRSNWYKSVGKNKQLQAELEQVKAEKAKAIENLSDNLRIAYQSRDAAVEDMTEMIGDIEEIRRGCGVDNADADSAFANLCGNYCANNGHCCYEESENYRCKHFEWRGMAKED